MKTPAFISRRWWNKGYMTSALKAVFDDLFEETDVIIAYYAVENVASGNVMLKVNMNYVCMRKLVDRGKVVEFPFYEIRKTQDDISDQ